MLLQFVRDANTLGDRPCDWSSEIARGRNRLIGHRRYAIEKEIHPAFPVVLQADGVYEKGYVNIGLGNGTALDIWNLGLKEGSFERLPKK
jgi:hypothetical protein